MEKTKKTTKKSVSVEAKLRSLYDIQIIDSMIDNIRFLRGELPLEVEDLKDEIVGLKKRKSNFTEKLENSHNNIKNHEETIREAAEITVKYKKQLEDVRNSRQFDALTKEIEYQDLETQLSQKKIKEENSHILQHQVNIENIDKQIASKEEHLKHKEQDLQKIIATTEKDEKTLIDKSEELSGAMDEILLNAYKRIRNSVKNGLAIVPIERGAARGSYFVIPPQIQMEVSLRRNIVFDEHSGRILVDAELAAEEEKKIKKLLKK